MWHVPGNLELNGNEETFTVEVIYETKELYGTVKASQEIVIERGTSNPIGINLPDKPKSILSNIIGKLVDKSSSPKESAGKVEQRSTNKNEVVGQLKEISAFEVARDYGNLRADFNRGQMGDCSREKIGEDLNYPKFSSEKPIYGTVPFGMNFSDLNSGTVYNFAVDKSRGTGAGYDRLYFDLNGDKDLTDDEVCMVLKNPPANARMPYGEGQQIFFNYLNIPFAFGAEGKRSMELMPRLYIEEDITSMTFVSTKARQGRIEIAGQPYEVLLGQCMVVGGWYDHPSTGMHLIPEGKRNRFGPMWWGADRLTAMHEIEGMLYCFSATPAGDRFIARKYNGDYGTFEIGTGGREIGKLSMSGSLQSRNVGVAVGTADGNGFPGDIQSLKVPVGDYYPAALNINYGDLRIFISNNYHSDGKPRDRGDLETVYGVKIRKDKPLILDFSNTPDVMFASPGKSQQIKLGEELSVMAVLIDPELDFMIRELRDTSRKQKEEIVFSDGRMDSIERDASLDPQVVIKRANGKKVAEGAMPFG
ncbi:hypothetical protein ACFL02_00455 [Planctomycetota bacterium]